MRDAFGLPPAALDKNWFLSDLFFEAFAEWDDDRFDSLFSDNIIDFIRKCPEHFLYDHIVAPPDQQRAVAIKSFSEGSERLRLQIEKRRNSHKDESESMRRKIYGALLLNNEIELILRIAKRAEIPWHTVSDMGGPTARRIVCDVPAYYIERELALRLEGQNRQIEENDFRDMQSFCAVIPYADEVIAENHFASLAKQAKLDQKYDTRITTSIFGLRESL